MSTDTLPSLYLILTAMFMVLFVINILQISLISETQNVYWIALCPALVFAGFLAYTMVYVTTGGRWQTVFSPCYSSKAAQKQAWHTSCTRRFLGLGESD